MRRVQHITISDEDGRIQIDWLDTDEMKPEGGQFHTTYVTMGGREADGQVDYYVKELLGDVDQLLHLVLKMLNSGR